MNDLSEKVDTIEIKVRQLALRIDRVQKERDKYLEENNKLRTYLKN
jgi:regulator of replication initiation timing